MGAQAQLGFSRGMGVGQQPPSGQYQSSSQVRRELMTGQHSGDTEDTRGLIEEVNTVF